MAELYDRARPSYPEALVEDVLQIAPTPSPQRALEVGAGTGKATVLFARRGLSVLALEPSPAMAAVAERNCAAYPNVAIERTEFELWRPRGGTFGLVFCAQAWHWVSPELRYLRARAALRKGGALAAFWNRPDWAACAFRTELDEAYRRFAPELTANGPMHPAFAVSADLWSEWEQEIASAPGLARAEVRCYPWARRYRTEEYVRLLHTHSDHIVLDRHQRELLLAEVAAVLDRNGGGLHVSYVTRLCLARAV